MTAGSRARQLAVVAVSIVLGGVLVHPTASARPDCGWGSFSDANQPGACWQPFSAESPFNRALPRNPQRPSDSRALAAWVAASGSGPRFYGGIAETVDDYSHPIYFSRHKNPVFTVNCLSFGGQCEIDGDRVRIPNLAGPAAGDDGHLAVIDQARGWEYDFWQVRSKPAGGGRLDISWGGKTRIGTEDAKGLGAGGTAADFALTAGVIRPAELRAGRIDHALFMTVPCTNGRSVYPAGEGAGSECDAARASAPAMGQHFYLAMSRAEIRALGIPTWQKTILRAMRRYGMYIGDTGGSGWGIKVESGSSATSFGRPDPWSTLARRLGLAAYAGRDGRALYTFDLGPAVDWSRELRVASPCVARGRCR
jgi:hypothetical protein